MSTVQLPDNNHVIDMIYKLLLLYLTCSCSTTWAHVNCEALRWSKADCSPLRDLHSEFSQRLWFILQSTHKGAIGRLEHGVFTEWHKWCPYIYILVCTAQISIEYLVTVWADFLFDVQATLYQWCISQYGIVNSSAITLLWNIIYACCTNSKFTSFQVCSKFSEVYLLRPFLKGGISLTYVDR